MKLTRFVVTIQIAEDKCRMLTLFKHQVLNDLEQTEKDNTSPVLLKGRQNSCLCLFCRFICILWR